MIAVIYIKDENIFYSFLQEVPCLLAEGAAAKTDDEDDREVVIDFLPRNCVCARDGFMAECATPHSRRQHLT